MLWGGSPKPLGAPKSFGEAPQCLWGPPKALGSSPMPLGTPESLGGAPQGLLLSPKGLGEHPPTHCLWGPPKALGSPQRHVGMRGPSWRGGLPKAHSFMRVLLMRALGSDTGSLGATQTRREGKQTAPRNPYLGPT